MPPLTFADLGVPAPLCDALARRGITTPTPIQAATLRDSLAGRDLLGRGRTGSGKTYAFLLPLLARLAEGDVRRHPKQPRSLIVVPTRELATQIEAAVAPLAKALRMRTLTVYGGVSQRPQQRELQAGVDVLIACPGRLEDLIRQGLCRLNRVEVVVLDEADHMADLGFLPGVHRIMEQTPPQAQRLLFSATLDGAVNVIVTRHMHDPITHQADSEQSPVDTMSHHVLHLSRDERVPVLVSLTATPERTLVFTRTKHGAKMLAKRLNDKGVPSVELHGNLAQRARERNLEAFHSGEATTLVATDIAARGIHVDDVALVIHADPPVEHKAYLHRSGRTARNGASGNVITLMHDDQVRAVRALTKAAGVNPTTTKVDSGHPLLKKLSPASIGHDPSRPPVRQPGAAVEETNSRQAPRQGGRPSQGGRSNQGGRPAAGSSGSSAGRGGARSYRSGTADSAPGAPRRDGSVRAPGRTGGGTGHAAPAAGRSGGYGSSGGPSGGRSAVRAGGRGGAQATQSAASFSADSRRRGGSPSRRSRSA